MSGTGKRKRPALVADKRPAAKSRKSTTKVRPKQKTSRRGRSAKRHKRGGVTGLFRRIIGWFLRLIGRLVWRSAVLVTVILALAVLYFVATLPPVGDLLDGRARGSVTLLDRNNSVYAWRGEQFGGQIDTDTISPHLKNAIIATEDKRFYRHFGLSPRGIASAVRINLREGRGPLSGNGGSTITQQSAKLLCLGVPYSPKTWESEAAYEADCRQGSLWRKIKEAVYALALEAKYSKDEVLTIYLNRVYLGAGSRGFEAASQRYFGKSAANVSPAEAAMLAGLLTAPSRYAPTANLQRSQNRAGVIVDLMLDQGYLTVSQSNAAHNNPAILSEAAQARAGGYFADWVVDAVPTFLTEDTTEDVVIRTTYDQRIQAAAEEALQLVFDTKLKDGSEVQAAIVVMSSDGAVRAMVGGRKFRGVAGLFNRAIQAKRQTGSAFKPFVYATALDLGYTYADTVLDEPLTIDIPGSGPWTPRNYKNEFLGPVTLTDALKYSLNIPAIRVSEDVGRENVRTIAAAFGIKSELAVGPALALGASESTLLEMTGAYAGILNGGSSVTPYGLIELRLQGDAEPLMSQAGGIGERVITPDAAKQLIYMMHQVVEGGTGQRAKLPGRETAAKTGTTQAARDAWYLGFTADYVAGVWMGYDDNTSLTGVTGGGLPAEIWRETMLRVHEGMPATPLPMLRVTEPPVVRDLFGNKNRQNGGSVADQIIFDVLQAIFGKRDR